MALWKPSRRLFLAGAGLIAAPAIVRAQSPQIRQLMLKQMPAAPAAGGAASYAFRAAPTGTNAGGGTSVGFASIPLGTATATRIAIVSFAIQNDQPFSSVTMGGATLSPVASGSPGLNVNSGVRIYAGVVGVGEGTSATLTANFSGASFNAVTPVIWTADGLTSNTAKASNGVGSASSLTLNTVAGDFLFAISAGTTNTFSGSTETPSNTHNDGANFNNTADWTIASTHTPFSVSAPSGVALAAAAWS